MSRRVFRESPQNNAIPITPEAMDGLRKKLARLKAGLISQANEVREAAALGDRSENEEYRIAKSTLRRMHRQIGNIEHHIKCARIIDESSRTAGFVGLGSTVEVEINGIRKIFRILGSFETNPAQGIISSTSPVGSALMNRVAGDEVSVRAGEREVLYRIIQVN